MAVLLALGAAAVPAQEVNVTGRVIDSAGAGLPGATVALLGRKLWTSTDQTGGFRLDWSSAVVPAASRRASSVPWIRAGRLCFTVTRDRSPVLAEVFDARGRVVARLVQGTLSPETYEAPLPTRALALGVYVVRVRVDQTETVLRLAGGAGSTSVRGRSALSVVQGATAGMVDTLAVTLPGYAPAKVLLGTFDTSLTVALQKRARVVFTIGSGTGYVTMPACTLVLRDSSLSSSSARFTQAFDSVPRFDQNDSLNPVRQVVLGTQAVATLPWNLLLGGGEKRVWAEVTWRDTARGRDTLVTTAAITPWAVDIRYRNSMRSGVQLDSPVLVDSVWQYQRWEGAEDPEMIHYTPQCPSPHVPCQEYFTIGRAPLLFSLDVHADTTFTDTFECWVLTPCSSTTFSTARPLPAFDTLYGLLETAPRSAVLTGSGPAHDTAFVYRYSVDTSTADGRENLGQLRILTWDRACADSVCIDTLRDIPAANFARLAAPRGMDYQKEFTLVLRLHGRFFGEERLVYSRKVTSLGGMSWRYHTSYFDFYAPSGGVTIPAPGDTLTGPTTIHASGFEALPYTASYDLPLLAHMELLVARKPLWVVWDCWNWTYATAPPVTLADLLQQRHEVFACDSPESSPCTAMVDPSGWESGEYLIAVVATDAFGNEGLALHGGGCDGNPLLVYVASGR